MAAPTLKAVAWRANTGANAVTTDNSVSSAVGDIVGVISGDEHQDGGNSACVGGMWTAVATAASSGTFSVT